MRSNYQRSNNQPVSNQRIAQQKLANIDALSIEATDALYYVEECQAVVDSLALKSEQFEGYLTDALSWRDVALRNLNEAQQLSAQTQGLYANLQSMQQQTHKANAKVKQTSGIMTSLVDELNLSSQVVDKLSALLSRKKALNPLISDELIVQVAKATTDCNTAVTATLKALQSCFISIASIEEASLITGLGVSQSKQLNEDVTGTELDVIKQETAYYQSCHELQHLKQDLAKLIDEENQLFQALAGAPADLEAERELQQESKNLQRAQTALEKSHELQIKLKQAKAESNSKLKQQLQALKKAEANLSEAQTDRQIKSASNAIEKEQAKVEKLEIAIIEAEKQLLQLQETIKTQKNDINTLGRSVQKHQQTLAANELASPPPVKTAQARYDQASAQLQQLQQQLLQTEQNINTQQAILATTERESQTYGRLEQAIADMNEQVSWLRRAGIPQAQKALSHAEQVMSKSQARYTAIEEKLQATIDDFNAQSKVLELYTQQQQPAALLVVAHNIHTAAKQRYQEAEDANKRVTKQLSEAQATLLSAQNNLQSLQAGLSAAKASTVAI